MKVQGGTQDYECKVQALDKYRARITWLTMITDLSYNLRNVNG
jgi:hypothetical protein